MATQVPCTGKLPVFVVDDHNEALPVIYRAIGKKSIPFSDLAVVHVDAHPDLQIPNLDPKDYFSKGKLFDAIHIATWLTPTVYAGHVSTIVWLKPPWSSQMNLTAEDRPEHLIIGCDKKTTRVRTSLLSHYFLNEGFCCTANDLVHQKKCDLYVSTVHPGQYGSCGPVIEPKECWPPGAKKFKTESCDPNTHFNLGSVLEHHKAWILDVDLDFFSTCNPFKKSFTKEQYDALTRLYSFPPYPKEPQEEGELLKWQDSRSLFLSDVKQFWENKLSKEDLIRAYPGLQDRLFNKRSAIDELKALLGSNTAKTSDDAEFDVNFVHTAGFASDLPEHFSPCELIDGLVQSLKCILQTTRKTPSLVTVARSSHDEYTPVSQVDVIQQKLMTMLTSLYKDIHLTELY